MPIEGAIHLRSHSIPLIKYNPNPPWLYYGRNSMWSAKKGKMSEKHPLTRKASISTATSQILARKF